MAETRDRILDALGTLLPEVGPAGATLEAVAARAEVSKGGLLYHFGSKEALFAGFLARLEEATAGEVERMRASADHGVETYLRISSVTDDHFTRTFLSALALIGTAEVDAAATVARVLATYRSAVEECVPDPVLARLVQLVGDGLYLNAMVGSLDPAEDDHVIARIVAMTRP
ncbi:TetR/AcrR family transcriptional regulator [Actinotalea sp. C106]|uniref:TetR/AcrR family transcriptional regulator n=1 Tax=Actinotalea sp. C106 TaxID=2908644 RepID=UPI00202943E0|nr:TetR/AcrR family transcriptional regulator [Actinotalea sp. C106]